MTPSKSTIYCELSKTRYMAKYTSARPPAASVCAAKSCAQLHGRDGLLQLHGRDGFGLFLVLKMHGLFLVLKMQVSQDWYWPGTGPFTLRVYSCT